MRTVHSILDDIIEINQKVEALRASIQEKETELKALKVGHKKLVIANVGQDRQPASLKVQREKILELETILEIESETIQELESKVAGLREEQKVAEFQELLADYPEKEADFLSKVNLIKGKITAIFDQINGLEPLIQDLLTCQNPVLDLDVIIGRMTHEQYLKINVPVSWDEIHGLQNNILSWRKQSQQFGTLVERFITYAGTLRHIHLNAPGAPITDTGVQPAARGVRVTVTKDDKPDDIYRNPDRYSVHTQRRFGLLPNQREKQPVKATG